MKRVVLSAIFLLPLFLNAQIVLTNAKEAMDLAKKNNRDLAIAEKRDRIEKQQVSITKGAFVPQVKAVSSFDYNYALPVQLIPAEFLGGTQGEFRTVQFGTLYNWSAGLEASMPLINASLIAENKVARYHYAASQEVTRNTELLAMKEASKGFYFTSLSASSLQISKENLKIADSLRKIAEHKFQNGLMEPIDYNRITNAYYRAKNEVERNQTILVNNTNSLKYYLGLNQSDSLVLTGDFEPTSEEIVLNGELENYPSVKEKQLLSTAAFWTLKRERYKRLPEISIYGRYMVQAQRNEFNFFNYNYPWYNLGVIGVRLEVPLYTGFSRVRNIDKMKYKYEIQKEEYEKELEKSKIEDQELKENYKSSLEITKNLEESYHLSQQNLKIALFKYNEGIYSLDQYLNVFNESLQIQTQYLNSLAELYSTRTNIELKNNL